MSKPHVLLVEDYTPLGDAIERLLKVEGISTTLVSTAADARHAAKKSRPFDVAIVDVHIGRVDGVDLAVELIDAGQIRRVVFYTGDNDPAVRMRATEVGVVVLKDGVAGLLKEVRKTLKAPASPRSPRGRSSSPPRRASSPPKRTTVRPEASRGSSRRRSRPPR